MANLQACETSYFQITFGLHSGSWSSEYAADEPYSHFLKHDAQTLRGTYLTCNREVCHFLILGMFTFSNIYTEVPTATLYILGIHQASLSLKKQLSV